MQQEEKSIALKSLIIEDEDEEEDERENEDVTLMTRKFKELL